ncbi:phosphotransferase [Paenibacillus sp. IB182496]|uniref:Phosphotransferase n=1 Tax=Paenibacillus sabuli TaxID=2772509 RepID=A0A927BVM1_9BACL|nr:phosphotransferase [Paenibacillus sabuli]MBD2847663.1 phosphotransferase [Paenibacillus sabuli]
MTDPQPLIADIRTRFGRVVTDVRVLPQGWLNVKWRMDSAEGPMFVKSYHPERYKLHAKPDRRRAIARTLELQHGLHAAGVPCPGVYRHREAYLHETPCGMIYNAMDWTEGQSVVAGSMSEAQCRSLGAATGRMHRWLRSRALPNKPVWTPDPSAYWLGWTANREAAERAGDELALQWIERSGRIVSSLDFACFEDCPSGWLHWDLWADNLLVDGDRLSGIVDFDRMAAAYPEIDVARALLSVGLQDGGLRANAARAFLAAYRATAGPDAPRLVVSRALRLLYVIESLWWLRTEVRREGELRSLLRRFVDELHWIEDNWEAIPDQVDGL